MLNVTFASNWGLFRTFIEDGVEEVYIKEGYIPFVDMMLQNKKVKINLFIEGVTGRFIADHYPDLADKIRTGIASGQFEMGTYTYNHPVLSLIPYMDTYKQMEEGLRIDRDVWGVEPQGTMLPEAGWDPTLPRILNDLGLTYMLLGNAEIQRDFPGISEDVFTKPFTVHGIAGSSVTSLVTNASDWRENEHAFYIEGSVIHDAESNVRDFLARKDEICQGGSGAGQILLTKNDGEFVYEGTLKRVYGTTGERGGYLTHSGESLGEESFRRAAEMKRGWDILTAREDIQFVTVSEYLAEHKPQREFHLRPSFKEHREWMEGSEKVGMLLDETRDEIRRAEYALKIAQKIGINTAVADTEIEAAWLMLLEAEISTGRRACAHVAGKAGRVYKTMEIAVTARARAEAAVDGL